jgi:hypothetical protein
VAKFMPTLVPDRVAMPQPLPESTCASASADPLARLAASLDGGGKGRGLPPVERWNPPYGGEIDMRIASDGTWFYKGSAIARPALVKLFSTVLRRDPERFVLVTPVERLGIVIEDMPFLAVEMAVEGEGDGRRIAFRTNVDDLVAVAPDHPLRFARGEGDAVKPYVLVRGGLWARLTRSLTYDLLELGEEREVDGAGLFGVAAGGAFFAVAPASEIAGL